MDKLEVKSKAAASDKNPHAKKKRKLNIQTTSPPSTQSPEPFTPGLMPNNRSLILELAAELRNNIYTKVLEDHPQAFLSTGTKANLATTSRLIKVNKQIHQEFLSVLYTHAPQIIARVNNFNFTHIVTFFNRLSDIELKTIPAEKVQTYAEIVAAAENTDANTAAARFQRRRRSRQRKMTIELCFKYNRPLNMHLLSRWLNRLAVPSKKGSNLKTSYTVKAGSKAPYKIFEFIEDLLDAMTDEGDGKEDPWDARRGEELLRMRASMSGGLRMGVENGGPGSNIVSETVETMLFWPEKPPPAYVDLTEDGEQGGAVDLTGDSGSESSS
ncbi:hypothetical protein MBLNU230_g4961t1 [Neophaeotheca triangularis]